ncbi:hypothetical protein BGZ94_009088 [Podila epigama]|nr:hypothetical protein BGZ94_009088 [Podila epigama]
MTVDHALAAYDLKPDCFKDAAKQLRHGCKSIDLDEDQKTQYELRHLQINLSRTHSDQLALIRAQRKELMETHILETAQLKEIQQLHSEMSSQMNDILTAASTIAQTTEKGASEQSLSLSNIKRMNEQFQQDFQAALQRTAGSVAHRFHLWEEMMNKSFSRFQELDILAGEHSLRMAQASHDLENVVQQVDMVAEQLHALQEQASQGTKNLVKEHDRVSKNITQSTMTLLENVLHGFDAMENQTQTSWNEMVEAFKAGSSEFQRDVSNLLTSTALDIGSMASESQAQLDQLNDDIHQLKLTREYFTWPWRMVLGMLTGLTQYYYSNVGAV